MFSLLDAERQRSPAAPCAPYGGTPCWMHYHFQIKSSAKMMASTIVMATMHSVLRFWAEGVFAVALSSCLIGMIKLKNALAIRNPHKMSPSPLNGGNP